MDHLALDRPGDHTIAYRKHDGDGPTVVWLGGFKSDMTGTKAAHLHGWAERAGRGFVRFDYFGHGASSGDFRDGTITRWRDDALAVIDELTEGMVLLVGSSMGGWLAMLAALARPERVKAIVTIAPALDMTETLIWAGLSAEARAAIMGKGVWARPSAHDPAPYPITRALIKDGRKHLLLSRPIDFRGPVRILHGDQDEEVPWQHSLKLVEHLTSPEVTLTLVKGGDHRLSTPVDLMRLEQTVEELCGTLKG